MTPEISKAVEQANPLLARCHTSHVGKDCNLPYCDMARADEIGKGGAGV